MKRNKSVKGYLLALSTILLFSVLIYFALENVAIVNKKETAKFNLFSIEKNRYIVDDIVDDIRFVTSTDIAYASSNQRIWLSENLGVNKSKFFSNYQSFLNEYENVNGANITFSYSDPLFIYFSDGLIYRSQFDGLVMRFYNGTNPGSYAEITSYKITIFSNVSRTTYDSPSFSSSGTLVIFDYRDPDPIKSFVVSGYLDPTGSGVGNRLKINLENGENVIITVGKIAGFDNAAEIKQSVPFLLKKFEIVANKTSVDENLTAYYNLPINVTFGNSNFDGFLPAS